MIYTRDYDFAFTVSGEDHKGHISVKTSWPGTGTTSDACDERMHDFISQMVSEKPGTLIQVTRTESQQIEIRSHHQAKALAVHMETAQALAKAQARHWEDTQA